MDSVIIVKTLRIWLSSEVISWQYGLINCEMRDFGRSFELYQSWYFNFGETEIAKSFQKTFHWWKLIWSVTNTEYFAHLRQECHNSKFGIFELLV